MRIYQKKELLDMIAGFTEIHDSVNNAYVPENENSYKTCTEILTACQEGAIKIGNMIDASEGEGTKAVHLLEEYCELVYTLSNALDGNGCDTEKRKTVSDAVLCLNTQMVDIGREIEDNITVRFEIAFMPYKASMWDSLESIYETARKDPDCDVHLVPIPYYDKNPDGSRGKVYYDGELFPEDEQVTFFSDYDLSAQKPDAIFIHNPYDEFNNVTSVFPEYYSHELKKYTDCLVYVPYYATAGGMNATQSSLSAYYYADYIVTQSEMHIGYFDTDIPRERFIAAGSPKFDHVIHECRKKQDVPRSWHEIMDGKKVYFYNTSITGALQDTRAFLNKMEYVFRTFINRENACLLWRPHPLLESTFESMRKDYKPYYDRLKEIFVNSKIGIYDDTPDIAHSIAVSDAYIGDAGTSVISLFGITGKPVFILNNQIESQPTDDDFKAAIVNGDDTYYTDWCVTEGNQLFYMKPGTREFSYVCRLDDYGDQIYGHVARSGEQLIICPLLAEHFLIVKEGHVSGKVELKHRTEKSMYFSGAFEADRYIFLFPVEYPAIVRLDKITYKIDYLEGYNDLFTKQENGEWKIGGVGLFENMVLLASPYDQKMLAVDINTFEPQMIGVGDDIDVSCSIIIFDADGKTLWFLPYTGEVIRHWNPSTGECRYYRDTLNCLSDDEKPESEYRQERLFSGGVVYNGKLILSLRYRNKLISLDIASGNIAVWNPPFEIPKEPLDSYYNTKEFGMIYRDVINNMPFRECRYFSCMNKKIYDIDLKTDKSEEIKMVFNKQELLTHEYGFCDAAPWNRYFCRENAFNSLNDFIDGDIKGAQFDRDKELKSYGEITANPDGTCGEKVFEFVKGKMMENAK